MSRSKDPSRYPMFCYRVMQELDETPTKPMRFTCKDRKQALNFKFTWNCFKRAALDAGWCDRNSLSYRGGVGATLANMVARERELVDGSWIVVIENINFDDAIARWNREAGCDEDEFPQDKDPPAYMRK